MNPGDAIWGLDLGDHLSVVLTAPSGDFMVAITNFTSHDKPSCGDHCVVVTPDEYPVLSRDSCLFYRAAWLNPVAPLDRARAEGNLREAQSVPLEVLAKIQRGALASRFTAHVVKQAIRSTLGMPQQ